MNKSRYNMWIARLNELRARLSEAEIDYWATVMAFEADADAWGKTDRGGYSSFEEVLHVAGLKSHHEYRKFRQCVEKFGSVDAVRQIGFAAAKELRNLPDHAPSKLEPSKSAVQAVYDELVEFRSIRGKDAAAPTAATHVRKHYDRPQAPRTTSRFDELKKENAYLKRENKKLRKQISELEKELELARQGKRR